MEGREITFSEMNQLAENLACGLIAAGHKPGDRIGVWGPNQSPWVITKWACYKAGFQLVTLNPMYTARELEYAVNKGWIQSFFLKLFIFELFFRIKFESYQSPNCWNFMPKRNWTTRLSRKNRRNDPKPSNVETWTAQFRKRTVIEKRYIL